MNTKSIPTSVALSAFIMLQPMTVLAANEGSSGRSDHRLDEIIKKITLSSFTAEEKKEIESSLRESLDINKLLSLGDVAFDAEDYAKSLSFYQRAFYAAKLLGPDGEDRGEESEDDEDTKSPENLARVSSLDFQLRLV